MRLLHFASSYFPRVGGIPATVRSIAHHTDFEHVLVCRDLVRHGPDKERAPAGEDTSDPRLTVHRFRSDGAYLTPEMAEFIGRGEFDVLMVHSPHPALLEAAKLTTRPVVCAPTGRSSYDLTEELRHVDLLMATTRLSLRYYVDECDYRGETAIFPRAVDVDLFKRGEHGDGKRLLYVGRISPEKRAWEVVRVAAELGRTLRIVGDYDHPYRDRPPLDDAIERYGVAVRISQAHTPEDVARAYQDGDVLVSASKRETFCRVFLEALVSGLAVASTATGGCREWASGWVEFVDDPADLADAAERAEPLNASQDVELVQNFSWQCRAREFEEIVKGVAE